MKRIVVLLAIIFALTSGSYALGFAVGGKAGIGMSKFTEPDTLANSGFASRESKLGLAWQVAAEMKLSFLPIIGLRFELGLSGYNGKFTYNDSGTNGSVKVSQTMFNVFLGPQLNISSFFLFAGIEAGFKLKSTYEMDNGIAVVTGDNIVKSPLWSLALGLGYEIDLTGPIKLPISVEFKYGLNSVGKELPLSQPMGNIYGSKAWAIYLNIGILLSI